MVLKKALAGAVALVTAAAMPCFSALAADDGASYKTGELDAVMYDNSMQKIDCRYYEAMPSVPYVSLADFYRLWSDSELTVTAGQDGTYSLKTPFDAEAVLDTAKDTLNAEETVFLIHADLVSDDSGYSQLYTRMTDLEQEELEGATDDLHLDFGKYNIDIIGDGDEIWFPLPTVCNLFTSTVRNAFDLHDTLFFRRDMFADDSFLLANTREHADYYAEQYLNGRPADLAEYNYNELCFTFDRIYGFPGRSPFTELIREKGLDGFLQEATETSQQVRDMLRSTDIGDYLIGIEILGYYLEDGGHTQFSVAPELNPDVAQKAEAAYENLVFNPEGMINPYVAATSKEQSRKGLSAARDELFANADNVEELANAVYCEKGDTAFFIFDSFTNNLDSWIFFYREGGEKPDDFISEFQECVLKADRNPAIRNFVIDVATNTGGYTINASYMLGLTGNVTDAYLLDAQQNIISREIFAFDKNLDRNVDEADEAFSTDLRFAVMESAISFSSGNLLPVFAKDNGIMVVGEQSGGGTCSVLYFLTPDGILYSLSTGTCAINKNRESVDNGVEPDYLLYSENEQGEKDFSAAYDIDTLDRCFAEFYPEADAPAETEPVEPVITETTTETTDTTASTTTTTTETTAATEETPVTEQAKEFATPDRIAEMAKQDYLSKNGTVPAVATVTDNGDGTCSVAILDKDGAVLDTYSIDKETGKGADSKGNAVDLPQTGSNAPGAVQTAAGALALMLGGFALMAYSGAIRRKEEQN